MSSRPRPLSRTSTASTRPRAARAVDAPTRGALGRRAHARRARVVAGGFNRMLGRRAGHLTGMAEMFTSELGDRGSTAGRNSF
ncbi:hypothetical protein [Haliangium sp.]|uniref:hypothetical protein n=1 Tax=Haliangium sp. TaxID=2663208 RepID=UPI003D1362BE